MDYRVQAIACVTPDVLPRQKALFEFFHRNLDELYSNLSGDAYFGRVITPGREYELGYPKCTCQKVLSGEIKNPSHCECSCQSILYVLEQLMPDAQIRVEIAETILRGGKACRFRIHIL